MIMNPCNNKFYFNMFARTFSKFFSFKIPYSIPLRNFLKNRPLQKNGFFKENNSFLINQTLVKAKNHSQLLYVFDKHKENFSLVNYSTFFKQLTTNPLKSEDIHNLKPKFQDLYIFLLKKLQNFTLNSEEARSISNLYHYLNRLQFDINYQQEIIEYLEKYSLLLLDAMNTQEFCLVIYNLGKNNKKEIIVGILDKIEHRLEEISFDKLTRLLYPLAIVGVHSKKADLKLKDCILGTNNLVKDIDSQDYSTIFFYLGKFHNSTFKDQFYEVIDHGKSLIHGLNAEGLINIVHSLTFIEERKMSPIFYKLCESKSIQLMDSFTDRQLTLLLRGFAIQEIGSKMFFEKYTSEIKKRDLKNEEIILILYHIANFNLIKNDFIEILDSFQQRITKNGFEDLDPQNTEKLFFSCFNLKSKGIILLTETLEAKLTKQIDTNLTKFTLKELGSICNMMNVLNENHMYYLLEKIVNVVIAFNQEVQETDLKSIAEIFFSTTSLKKHEENRLYISKILGISTKAAKIALNSKTHIRDLFYLRYYAKLIVSLSLIHMDIHEDEERRTLYQRIEDMIVLNRKLQNKIHDDLLMETVLFNLIIGYYTIKYPVSKEFKMIFKEALAKLDLTTSKNNYLSFLKTKTDLSLH